MAVLSLAACLCSFAALGQGVDQLAAYKPATQVSGTIRVGGTHHLDVLLNMREMDFHKFQAGIRFQDSLKSTATSIPALSFGLIDVGVMGRAILPLETLEFRREYLYTPTEVVVATGSYNVTLETAAFGIFVNKDNPLAHLSLKQLDAIFGYEHKRGAPGSIRTWGHFGLTGEWADKPIHTYGFATARFDRYFEDVVVVGRAKWNPDMHEYSDIYPPDGNPPPVVFFGELTMKDLAKDKYGIAYCSIAQLTPFVKAIALSEKDNGPYVPLTRDTVADRTYPLTRSIYIYVNRAPGKPLDPAVNEFLHYILSRQGQQQVARQQVYFHLTPDVMQSSLNLLKTPSGAQ
jgi:phosphate transport system substrate-binding protein